MRRDSILLLPVLLLLEHVDRLDTADLTRFATDCVTPNSENGLCIEIQNCAKLFREVELNNVASYEFIRASRCGPANEDPSRPKVCCGPDTNFVNKERSCTTPNNERARCIPVLSCKTFLAVINEADEEQGKFLRESVCGYDREQLPIVCCGSTTRYNNVLPDRSQCGTQLSYKVLNGEDTDINEFPWMALLEQTKTTGDKSYGCGGSLISKRYVLTAAHCVTSPTSTVTKVRLGEWDLDSLRDCVGTSCSPPPQDMDIEKIIPHEGYRRTKQGVFDDIALIRLSKPVTLNDFVQPICLPLPVERSNVGERLYVAGWGATETKRYSAKKQKLLVPIVDMDTCKSTFGRSGITVNEKMLCAGGEKDKDSCKGDSGGPLIAQAKNDTEQYYIEGIVSFGTICGTEGWPGIYTRVTDYLDWIRRNVKP